MTNDVQLVRDKCICKLQELLSHSPDFGSLTLKIFFTEGKLRRFETVCTDSEKVPEHENEGMNK
ncbi:MAG: hypothetical protein MI717_00660 [Spirochaetales bacterium]|nr:hypothetical protein [Spirochaetales bacterium]